MSFEGWKKYKLGEVADVQNGYAFKSEEFAEHGMPVIKIKNIVSPKIEFNDVQYYNSSISNKLEQFVIRKKDLLISMTGSNLNQIASAVGKVGRYQYDFPALLNQRVGKVFITNKEIIDEDFLFYILNRFETQLALVGSAGGSANQANISPSQIRGLELYLPDLLIQRKLASILSSLDDKIELNWRTNETLEAIAQILFKEWFVEFKFPGATGEMVESELGTIPKGWTIQRIKEIGKVVTGTTPPNNNPEYYGDFIPFITPTDFKNYNKIIIKADRYLSYQGTELLKNRLLPRNSIIVTCIGSDMGKVAINKIEAITNQQINSIITQELATDYLYHFLLSRYDLLRSMATGGSTMPIINKSQFEEVKVIVPSNEILERFWKVLQPLNNAIENQIQESKSLADVRDNLLPKLLKGEINL